MEGKNRVFINKFNDFDLRVTRFIRSSKVQNIVAVFLALALVRMYVELGGMLTAESVNPEADYFHRQAIYFHTFATLGYTVILLFTSYYRITKIPNLEVKLFALTQKLYSKEIVQYCFEPLIADWKKESSEAAAAQRVWEEFWISTKYILAFAVAMVRQSFIGRLIESVFLISD